MKRLFIFSTFLLCLLSTTFSQQSDNTIKPNLKYGKPSKEEFTMTSFAPDTTATAIYLFRKGESSFAYKDGFQLVTEHWVRIKVLKPQGVSYADITVPYYSPSDKDKGQERASEINGCSYNMENGQCVETPLKRDLISDERVNQHIRLLKFSIPAVKGIEFGTGFDFAGLRGSEANDAFRMTPEGAVVTASNHNAGINGGIANGMPVVFRTVVKPTPSIYKQQDTVDYLAKKDAQLSIQGRHDPCIVPRAAIVQTCSAALAVADLLTARYGEAWMTHPTSFRKEDE